jgi:hypothetical protein
MASESCWHQCPLPDCGADFEHRVPVGSPTDTFYALCPLHAQIAAIKIRTTGMSNDTRRSIPNGRVEGMADNARKISYALVHERDLEQSLALACSTQDEKSEMFSLLAGDY